MMSPKCPPCPPGGHRESTEPSLKTADLFCLMPDFTGDESEAYRAGLSARSSSGRKAGAGIDATFLSVQGFFYFSALTGPHPRDHLSFYH